MVDGAARPAPEAAECERTAMTREGTGRNASSAGALVRRSEQDTEAAWRQVLERDGAARFFYAVTSTGIFCRPCCPSRRPARRNVVYFRHAGEAMAAGFRACLRCQPAGIAAEAASVARICAHLEANVNRKVTLAELGALVAASPFTVQRMVARVLGITPLEYQLQLRASALRRALRAADMPITSLPRRAQIASVTRLGVTDAIFDAGYSSSSRAYQSSPLGMSPGTYRARGAGQSIRFAMAECSLGVLLVAATQRGVCSVALGDSREQLEAGLRKDFPAATIVAGQEASAECDETYPEMEKALVQLLSQMTEHPAVHDLPLDVRATAFQTRVWQALNRIPRGETRSYSQVAESLGSPRAVRAVARACASNPIAMLVPCHRVVGSDGKLTGYRWGVERKRRLLQIERG